jgi:hypothetical protein
MKIFIPNHLRDLVVVDQLAKLLTAYNAEKTDKETAADGINQDKCIDPVKKFIYMKLNPEDEMFTTGSQNYADVVNYLTTLFYSVKGTQKVLEYMIKYLGFSNKDIIYDAKTISIFPPKEQLGDETLYYNTLLHFLEELLYFQDFKTDLGSISLVIDHKVSTRVQAGSNIHHYKTIIIKQEV